MCFEKVEGSFADELRAFNHPSIAFRVLFSLGAFSFL